MLMLFTAATALLTAPLSHDSAAALRWGGMGHRVIARVAAGRLSPEAKREVRRLLGRETLAKVSTWADEVRRDRPATAPWHYVNIPIYDSVYRPEKVCPKGCVISALEAQVTILADRNRPAAERAEALKWVVHLVGDLHQPMHVGDRGDRGGNDVRISYDDKAGNLHGLWDTGLLLATGQDEDALVTLVERRLRRRGDLEELTGGSVLDWAMESHAASRDVVYGFLPASLSLDRSYLVQVQPLLEDRLLRGGARLAALIERALTVQSPQR
jgi:hypothetical protein